DASGCAAAERCPYEHQAPAVGRPCRRAIGPRRPSWRELAAVTAVRSDRVDRIVIGPLGRRRNGDGAAVRRPRSGRLAEPGLQVTRVAAARIDDDQPRPLLGSAGADERELVVARPGKTAASRRVGTEPLEPAAVWVHAPD